MSGFYDGSYRIGSQMGVYSLRRSTILSFYECGVLIFCSDTVKVQESFVWFLRVHSKEIKFNSYVKAKNFKLLLF